jgi:ABC-type polysaccharide/polyol phosphate export permease
MKGKLYLVEAIISLVLIVTLDVLYVKYYFELDLLVQVAMLLLVISLGLCGVFLATKFRDLNEGKNVKKRNS